MEKKDIDFLTAIFDNRYRKVDDCNDIMGASDSRQDKVENSLTEVRTLLKVVIAILSAIGATLLPVCIKYLFGG